MPRAKVHQSQRQRAAEACNLCREAKKRCSGSAPCTQCVQRGVADSCFITFLPRGTRTKSNIDKARAAFVNSNPQPQATSSPSDTRRRASSRKSLNNNNAGNESFFPPSPSDSPQATFEASGVVRSEASLEPIASGVSPTTVSTEADSSHTTLTVNGPRMLRSNLGEPVYIGAAASITFLRTVRQIVASQIGPSPFSSTEGNESMLEVESPRAEGLPMTIACNSEAVELDYEQKAEYLQSYYSVTEAFIDIFDPAMLEEALTTSTPRSLTSPSTGGAARALTMASQQACLDLVIAIGAQCSSRLNSQGIGRGYFRQAQARAFSGLIEDPDINIVRAFLLMAFYMLGDCRRNTAYMYFSIATRGALALGLHSRDSYTSKPKLNKQDQMRLRLWISIRIMDKLVNAILDRPAVTQGIQTDMDSLIKDLAKEANDHRTDCLVATNDMVSIISDINEKLYHKKEVTVATVEQLLEEIDSWKRKLPPSVKSCPGRQSSMDSCSLPTLPPKGAVGNIHVSSLYYFAVTLATRPIFMSSLTLKPACAHNSHHPLAAACLDSATFLAQTCVDALRAGLLPSNMCILKALIFSAGLVLGVECFAKVTVNQEIEAAYEGAKEVLGYIALRSPQAAHYFEILTSLSSVIAKRRSKAPPTGGRYVSRIFSLDSSATPDAQLREETAAATMPPAQMGAMWEDPFSTFSGDAGEFNWPEVEAQLEGSDMNMDWDSLNISQWDNFPYCP